MQSVFHIKLYTEGLKKIRLVGIISAVLYILINALSPLFQIIRSLNVSVPGIQEEQKEVLNSLSFAPAAISLLLITPFFILAMFSFLNKRNESDFYHAIPFKRSCVQISFLLACYTWIFGILIASLAINTVLWTICPNVTFSITLPLSLLGIYAASALYVGSFVMLAMTLSGTVISNIAVTGILAFLFRILSLLFTLAVENLIPLFDMAFSPMRIFSIRYWLPGALIQSNYDASILRNVGLWVYTGIVTVLLYALSILLYRLRKSESATKSAPERWMQHAFRIAFTLPAACLTAFSFVSEDAITVIIMILLTLACYYLYELITTKNIKRTLACTPMLIVPALCAALFIGSAYSIRSAVLNAEYDADEIESIRLYDYASIYDFLQSYDQSYEDVQTSSVYVKNSEAIQLVSKTLKDNIAVVNDGKSIYSATTSQNVEIVLKNGKKIGRMLYFKDNYRPNTESSGDLDLLKKHILSSPEYLEAYLKIPAEKEIHTYLFPVCPNVSEEDAKALWRIFAEEYGTLSDSEKMLVKGNGTTYNEQMLLGGRGTCNGESFTFNYTVTDRMPKTRAKYLALLKPEQEKLRSELTEIADGKKDDQFTQENAFYSFASLSILYTQDKNSYASNIYFSPEEDNEKAKEMLQLILDHLTDEPTSETNCSVTLHTFANDNGYIYRENKTVLFGLKPFSKEEAERLGSYQGGYGYDYVIYE